MCVCVRGGWRTLVWLCTCPCPKVRLFADLFFLTFVPRLHFIKKTKLLILGLVTDSFFKEKANSHQRLQCRCFHYLSNFTFALSAWLAILSASEQCARETRRENATDSWSPFPPPRPNLRSDPQLATSAAVATNTEVYKFSPSFAPSLKATASTVGWLIYRRHSCLFHQVVRIPLIHNQQWAIFQSCTPSFRRRRPVSLCWRSTWRRKDMRSWRTRRHPSAALWPTASAPVSGSSLLLTHFVKRRHRLSGQYWLRFR